MESFRILLLIVILCCVIFVFSGFIVFAFFSSLSTSSRWRSPCNHLQPFNWRSGRHLLWRTSLPSSLVPVSSHLWHPLPPQEDFVADRIEGSPDGQHFAASLVPTKRQSSAEHVPSAGLGLRRESSAVDLQRSSQVGRREIQRVATDHTTSAGEPWSWW